MTKEQIKEYYTRYNAVQKGYMTEGEWSEYCKAFLFDLVEENKDVLERLKDR